MLKFLPSQAQARFRELQGKLGSFAISPEEQQELADLVARGQKIFQERDSVIDRLKAEITENAITPRDLFTPADLRAAARQIDVSVVPPSSAAVAGRRRTARPAKEAPTVLIRAKVGKGAGAPSKYHKGQKLPAVVPRNFKALDEGGALSENLAQYFTDAGRAYFGTPEGQSELRRFENYIRNGKTAD